jgi:regulatory protein
MGEKIETGESSTFKVPVRKTQNPELRTQNLKSRQSRAPRTDDEMRSTRNVRRVASIPDRWLQLALRALARSDRTTIQIERLLTAKGATPGQVRTAVRRLTSLHYLDDVAFASRWADRRLARMPMGRARLQEELLATGCPDPIVQATLRVTYRKVSERDLAMQVVATVGKIASPQMLGRVARLLSQRGFDEDTIETVVEPLMRERS